MSLRVYTHIIGAGGERCVRFVAMEVGMGLTMGVKEIAEAIKVEEKAVYEMARRERDPLPLLIVRGKRRGAFAKTADVDKWIDRNCVRYADARMYAHEDMRGRENHG